MFYSAGQNGVPTKPIIDENDRTPGQHVIGGEFGAGPQLFGTSVAVADVNGDGTADLIVGAPAALSGAGVAYVFHSTPGIGLAQGNAINARSCWHPDQWRWFDHFCVRHLGVRGRREWRRRRGCVCGSCRQRRRSPGVRSYSMRPRARACRRSQWNDSDPRRHNDARRRGGQLLRLIDRAVSESKVRFHRNT